MSSHFVPRRPRQDRCGRELSSVIADDHARLALPGDERAEFACHPSPRDRGVGDGRRATLTPPRFLVRDGIKVDVVYLSSRLSRFKDVSLQH